MVVPRRVDVPILIAAAMIGQGVGQAVEQLAPPLTPDAATRTDQARKGPRRDLEIVQLPSDPRAVDQPEPVPAPPSLPAIGSTRAYVTILGPGRGAIPEDTARTLGLDTITRLTNGVDPVGLGAPTPKPVIRP